MKILHSSDWHLGQTFYDYDRGAEQRDMLRQIAEIVRDEQPDALLVSGDVFHTGNPSPAAVRMYNSALLEMHSACPSMHIIVTGGNHDSATRLMVNNELWDYFSVNVLGSVARHNDDNHSPNFDPHIIEVSDAAGNPAGFVAAVPHCYESNFPSADASQPREERVRAYFQGLLDEVAKRNTLGLPVVLMAHLAVNGCDFSGHENIGGMETRDVAIFGKGYDYVALGHIHTPQDISDRVRYCGTPIPVNFGEKFEHSVSVVTLTHGEKPQIKTRKITNLIPLHDFPQEPEPFSVVLEKIKDYPADHLCYLRLLVKVDNSLSPLAETLVAEAVKEKKCRMCRIQPFVQESHTVRKPNEHVLTTTQLRAKTPVEIAEMFFAMKGLEMTEKQKEMLKSATITAEQEEKGDDHEA